MVDESDTYYVREICAEGFVGSYFLLDTLLIEFVNVRRNVQREDPEQRFVSHQEE